MKIYLAGPIEGVFYNDAVQWRESVSIELIKNGHDVFSPLTQQECCAINDDEVFDSNVYYKKYGFNPGSIFYKDIFMINQSDCVLVNLNGSGTFGTPFEIGYAYALGKMIVIIADEAMLKHPFIMSGVGFTEMDKAINYINSINKVVKNGN